MVSSWGLTANPRTEAMDVFGSTEKREAETPTQIKALKETQPLENGNRQNSIYQCEQRQETVCLSGSGYGKTSPQRN